jgi:hypothetical protein
MENTSGSLMIGMRKKNHEATCEEIRKSAKIQADSAQYWRINVRTKLGTIQKFCIAIRVNIVRCMKMKKRGEGANRGVQMAGMNCWLICQNKQFFVLEWDKLSQNSFLVSNLAHAELSAQLTSPKAFYQR